MNWFFLFFPLAMTIAPAAVLFVPTRTDEPAAREVVRRLSSRLVVATVFAAVIVVLAWLIRTYAPLDDVAQRIVHGATHGIWIVFFPIWFLLAMPLLAAKRPDLETPAPSGPRRAASLTARDDAPILRAWHWIVVAASFAIPASFVVWRAITHDGSTTFPLVIVAIAFVQLGFVALFAGPAASMPEPLGAGEDAEIEAAYARLRRLRAWIFLGLGAVLGHGALLLAVAFAFEWSATTLAWVGSGVGLAGALFGTITGIRASMHGSRINRRLNASNG